MKALAQSAAALSPASNPHGFSRDEKVEAGAAGARRRDGAREDTPFMYEIDFLRGGTSNGDAICIRHGRPQPGYYLHIVDGGFRDTAQMMIDHIETNYGEHYFIHHMVVSHADGDHA